MPTAGGVHAKSQRSCFAPPNDTDGARWLDHLRARATSVDADSMPELGHGLCKPWYWPWSGRRPWADWKSGFVRRALFSLSSAFERAGVTTRIMFLCLFHLAHFSRILVTPGFRGLRARSALPWLWPFLWLRGQRVRSLFCFHSSRRACGFYSLSLSLPFGVRRMVVASRIR